MGWLAPEGGQVDGFRAEKRRRLVLSVLLSRRWPTFALGRVSEVEANVKAAQVGYLLLRLKQRLIELPPGVGIVDFVRYDGKPPGSLINWLRPRLPPLLDGDRDQSGPVG